MPFGNGFFFSPKRANFFDFRSYINERRTSEKTKTV
nr:MAG TPA: hypothetical protein [Caudoviricetes sp.]